MIREIICSKSEGKHLAAKALPTDKATMSAEFELQYLSKLTTHIYIPTQKAPRQYVLFLNNSATFFLNISLAEFAVLKVFQTKNSLFIFLL
jgi:hypothetical protein